MDGKLPIEDVLEDIKKSLQHNNTLILQAPPGAGKSTLLPIKLLDEPWLNEKKIIMLEPRRLAAKMVTERMAQLLDEPMGKNIGYRIRFENKTSKQTRLEVVTEGILTRKIQNDSLLEDVGLVIFDEFHERSLHADLALALCRELQQVIRNDLRILIMSATLDGEKLAALLNQTPIITSRGRQHPIHIQYQQTKNDSYIWESVASGIKQAVKSYQGDILAFLPGAFEIQKTQEILENELDSYSIHPLYGELPATMQLNAIKPHPLGIRKIVLATSIAETSLTIEGIKVVVDSGYSRTPKFDSQTGLTKLQTVKVTKATADQRAGRAGRLGPGVCIRMWSEATQHQLVDFPTPEIMEADLTPTLLELANWGKTNLNDICWLNTPTDAAINYAKEVLTQLDALEGQKISERGKELLKLPTHPRIAHLLMEGKKENILALACDVAALIEERDPLPKETGSNICLRLEALRKWRKNEFVNADKKILERIEKNSSYWRKLFLTNTDNGVFNEQEVGKLILAAYPERLAKRKDESQLYRLKNGKLAKVNLHDVMNEEQWIAIAHLEGKSAEGKIYLAAPLNQADILHLAEKKEIIEWDSQKGIIYAREELKIGDIIVQSKPLKTIPEQEKKKILKQVIFSEGFKLFNWNENTENFLGKISSLKIWRKDLDIPDVNPENIIENCENWIDSYLTEINKREDFLKINIIDIIYQSIPYQLLQQINSLAPDSIKVPSGSLIPVKYNAAGNNPTMAVRLQELFGLSESPTVNEGRIKLTIQILSPGFKPVQITSDLASFWKNTYPGVKKELKVKYLRHYWPDDPLNATALKGAKKRGMTYD